MRGGAPCSLPAPLPRPAAPSLLGSQSEAAPATSRRSERRAAGRAAELPLRLQEGNLISQPERRRATRCLWCCNIIESAPLGRATRRQRGRGGAGRRIQAEREGPGRGGGTPRPLRLPSQAKHPPFTIQPPAWAPPPHPKFCYNREPRSRPRALPSALPRPQSPLRPARARSRECGFRSAARPALLVSRTRGTWNPPAVGAPPEPTNLGRGRAREPPPPSHPRAHLSCQGPAAPPRLTHAGATVARVCLNCLSHSGLCGGGSAARGGGASGAWAKKHLLLSPPRTHPSATPPTPRPRLAPGALTSAGGRCRVSAASARARAPTDRPEHPARSQPAG